MYPTELNYRMPPEWARHARTYIAWPVKSSMCHPEDYDVFCCGFAEIIRAIAQFEPVTIVVNPADLERNSCLTRLIYKNRTVPSLLNPVNLGKTFRFKRSKRTVPLVLNPVDSKRIPGLKCNNRTVPLLHAPLLQQCNNRTVPLLHRIELLCINHNDAWLRDNGPTFLVNNTGEVAGVNWRFNAWGGKYAPWDLDDQVAAEILNAGGVKCFDAPLVMEGGSFHVDGEGTLLTTKQCLLNPNRNPQLTSEQIEGELKKFLNIRKVIWLKKGLDGDETDGHIDNIACFAAPGKILIQVCDDPEDENFQITQENLQILGEETDARGKKIELIRIKQPPKLCDPKTGRRYTLSYLNFYFVNGGLILPVFGGPAEETDRLAVQVLSELFPERRIRTVDGMKIVREGGNVHCITQQMPEGVK